MPASPSFPAGPRSPAGPGGPGGPGGPAGPSLPSRPSLPLSLKKKFKMEIVLNQTNVMNIICRFKTPVKVA